MATLIVTLVTTLALVASAPITNSTLSDVEPSFVPQPEGRGTVGLLSSCLLTLILCVWTAIHPNIVKNPSPGEIQLYKIGYGLLGLLAPEIVLGIAFGEYRRARKLRKVANLTAAAAIAEATAKEFDGVDAAFKELEIDEEPKAINKARRACDDSRNASREAVEATEAARNAARLKDQLDTSRKALKAAEVARLANQPDAAISRPDTEEGQPGTQEGLPSAVEAQPDNEEGLPDGSVMVERQLDGGEGQGEPDADEVWLAAEKKQGAARGAAKSAKSANSKALIAINDLRTSGFLFHKRWWKRLKYYIEQRSSRRLESFSLQCSFFAVMGGYSLSAFQTPDTSHDRALTTDRLILLLRHGMISAQDLAQLKEEVEDRGKSDTLAKLLTCAQALWMMLNCLSRKIAGLPITLLEINVVVHVFCALSMYVFWWKKPHNAGRAISLSPKLLDYEPSCLLIAQAMYGEKFRVPKGASGPETRYDPERAVVYNNPTEEQLMKNKTKLPVMWKSIEIAEEKAHTEERSVWNHWIERVREINRLRILRLILKPDTLVLLQPDQVLVDEENGFTLTAIDYNYMHMPVTQYDINLLAEASRYLRESQTPGSHPKPLGLNTLPTKFVTSRWGYPSKNDLFWAVVSLSLVFGGVHASPWNYHFPTLTERLLWRNSCILIASTAFVLGVIVASHELATKFQLYLRSENQSWKKSFLRKALVPVFSKLHSNIAALKHLRYRIIDKVRGISPTHLFCSLGVIALLLGLVGVIIWAETRRSHTVVCRALEILLLFVIVLTAITRVCSPAYKGYIDVELAVFCTGLGLFFFSLFSLVIVFWVYLYLAGRVYIVVESFISLRSLPKGSFKTIAWQDFWPHL